MTPPQPDPDQVLRLPAIEIRQGKQRIYMFGIDGKELPRIATISRVHRDDEGDIGGYQRPEVLAHVGEIRGRGPVRGIELVADRATKEPFDPALKLHAGVKDQAMDCGLICYPGGGTADGVQGDHILLAPPFIIEKPEIDELVDRLSAAIDAAIKDAC